MASSSATSSQTPFTLSEDFIATKKHLPAPWSAKGNIQNKEDVLAALVYYRTYSRGGAPWWQTIRRVVEGTFRIQQQHLQKNRLPWCEKETQELAQNMYDRMFAMKFLPPGRGLWAMGTPIIEKKGLAAALNNCGYCTTAELDKDPTGPFQFLMDASMLGVGIGGDCFGAGLVHVHTPRNDTELFVVPDTREGWVEAVVLLLKSYFHPDMPTMEYDYSQIRAEGLPLVTFGGESSGPGPLIHVINSIRKQLESYRGRDVDSLLLIDIQNMIGVAVVSGNIRRTAEIMFGDADDEEFLSFKDETKYPERNALNTGWAWTSNNSVRARVGMSYKNISEKIRHNRGEPGLFWLSNAQAYSRMCDKPDYKDYRASGTNPCGEQTLEDGELCNLVETFMNMHTDKEDFLETLQYAVLYAKTVTLLETHWPKTNAVMLRNRRVGVSLTGIAQFLDTYGIEKKKDFLVSGYKQVKECDVIYSDRFCVPLSIKLTTVKPSGTVSLLAGASPGIHFPFSRYYIRRVTLSKNSPYVEALRDAGYVIETSTQDPEHSVKVEIPVARGDKVRSESEVSMWEQFALAAFLQKYWSDNQVSCTIKYNPDTEGDQIESALNFYQYQLKGISFLECTEHVFMYKVSGKVDETRLLAFASCKYDQEKHETLVTFYPRVTTTEMKTCLSALNESGYRVKDRPETPYAQMPYEAITKEMYEEMTRNIKEIDWEALHENMGKSKEEQQNDLESENLPSTLRFCDGDKCTLESTE